MLSCFPKVKAPFGPTSLMLVINWGASGKHILNDSQVCTCTPNEIKVWTVEKKVAEKPFHKKKRGTDEYITLINV